MLLSLYLSLLLMSLMCLFCVVVVAASAIVVVVVVVVVIVVSFVVVVAVVAQCCLLPRQWLRARALRHVDLNNHSDVPRDSEFAGQSDAVKLRGSSRVMDDHAGRLVSHHRVGDIPNSKPGHPFRADKLLPPEVVRTL